MDFYKKLIFASVSWLLASCSTTTPTIDNETVVKLKRTACFGNCPVYTVSVKANGVVEYEGNEYVSIKGFQTGNLPKESVELIEKKLIKVKFLKMKSHLDSGSWGCFISATDSSYILIEGLVKNRKKAVSTYLGCESKQVYEVINLAEYIDQVVGTSKWVKETAE
ncbi:DUF6438 domain-containing protein [Alishewanella tabrizica]|uniref:DUF6438 domain-containing protein n=1 Tax=Alishewanella tabrizica TaxID=671278 RepID=A0ABQ2WXA0_9ALTE|nr:DUF6438 domain-containing protein [Alishewanella tabrizica]GGW74272.1 hypothetical protein GCM10008111_32340 [Alishewanella tabrizica]